MSDRDYYEILGVPKDASQSEIKTAFRALARKFHPDVSQEENAEERFKEINEAYAVVSDEEKRAAYDRYGHAGLNGFGGAPDFSNLNIDDLFNMFGIGDIFGFGGRGGGRQSNRPSRGSHLQYVANLEFKEAVFGLEKEIQITRDEPCDHCKGEKAEPGTSKTTCATCKGHGEVRQARQTLFGNMVQVTTCPTCNGAGETISDPCKQCQGRGLERKTSSKTVDIPGGVDNGTQIRLSGEGQPGQNGGPPGDLYIIIKVKSHKFFRRKENDILLNLDINIAQASLGTEVEIPTVDGPSLLKIPSGTQPGKILRMRNKGVPHLRRDGRGDQLVVINVETPTRLNQDQRELMEQLAESLGTEVKPQERSFLDSLRDLFGG